eukprot:3760013-Rhodomonas_salina.3
MAPTSQPSPPTDADHAQIRHRSDTAQTPITDHTRDQARDQARDRARALFGGGGADPMRLMSGMRSWEMSAGSASFASACVHARAQLRRHWLRSCRHKRQHGQHKR